MADAVARREARRRRILENSHNRLQLISGKINDESYRDSPRRTPIPDQNVDVPFITEVNTVNTCFLNNGVINTEMETLTTTNANEVNNIEVTNDLAAFISSSSTDTHTESSLVDNLLTYKYDVVLLSLFLQFLYGLSILTFEMTYFFLPLILYTVTKVIFFPTQNNSNVANVLLLLNGFSAQNVKIIMNVMNLAMIFSRDICVYLFTTICIQSLWYVMNLNSALREVY